MSMPTYERRFYIEQHKGIMEQQKTHMEEQGNRRNGKGTRSFTPGINGPQMPEM